MTLASFHLSYVVSAASRNPAAVDRLLSLPHGQARTRVSEDIKKFLKAVFSELDGRPSSDLASVATAVEVALFDLYGPPENAAEDGEYRWETIENDDRRTSEFYALVVDALGSKEKGCQ